MGSVDEPLPSATNRTSTGHTIKLGLREGLQGGRVRGYTQGGEYARLLQLGLHDPDIDRGRFQQKEFILIYKYVIFA